MPPKSQAMQQGQTLIVAKKQQPQRAIFGPFKALFLVGCYMGSHATKKAPKKPIFGPCWGFAFGLG
jgi:hypothetical protein